MDFKKLSKIADAVDCKVNDNHDRDASWVSPDYVIEVLKERLPKYSWELWENAEGEIDATAVYDVDAELVKTEVEPVLKECWPNADFEFDTSDGDALYIM